MVTNSNRRIVHLEPQPGKQKVTRKGRGSQRVKQIRNQFSIPVKFPDTPPDIGTRNRNHKRARRDSGGRRNGDKYSNVVFMEVHRHAGGLIDAKAALFSRVGNILKSAGGNLLPFVPPPFLPVSSRIFNFHCRRRASYWMHHELPRRAASLPSTLVLFNPFGCISDGDE